VQNDEILQMTKCGRAGAARVAPEIQLYHRLSNLSIGKLHKLSATFYPGIVHFSQIEKKSKKLSNPY
jgi:hypothetical protein